MKIIILGAGQVGSSIAAHLSRENNDVTVVDTNMEKLNEMQNQLDIRTVHGYASHPSVLIRAGANDADMVVALTNSDEVNMVACQVCYSLFHTPTKIARIREAEYATHPEMFEHEHVPIDFHISPEQMVTRHIYGMIEYAGAKQVMDFAGGKAQLVTIEVKAKGPLDGQQLREFHHVLPENVGARVAAIFRDDKSVFPEGETVLKAGDLVFVLAAKKHIKKIMESWYQGEKPAHKIIIAGGGNIGFNLARALERDHSVKIIEYNKERSRFIAEELNKALVIRGDCTSEEILQEENINQADIFCALTNDDQANLLAALLAKKLGAKKVMTLINRQSYAQLIDKETIDIAVSPQHITMGGILAHVRGDYTARVHSLRQGAAEAIEVEVKGDPASSKVVGKLVQNINLPLGCTIGGIVRNNKVIMAHRNLVIEHLDHLIMFVTDKRNINDLKRLFEVDASFL